MFKIREMWEQLSERLMQLVMMECLFRSIRHQASLFIFSVIWLFLRAAAFL